MGKHILQYQVDQAMASIDDIQRAYPKPFFFTRLQARIARKEKNPWEKASKMLARPAIAFLSILSVVAINTVVILNKTSASKAVPEHAETVIADEYNSTVAYYAIENVQP